jgi:hypothetical protein
MNPYVILDAIDNIDLRIVEVLPAKQLAEIMKLGNNLSDYDVEV